jgi:hypothetical protein
VAYPANQLQLRPKSDGRGRADGARTTGFPLRLVGSKGQEEDVPLGIAAVRVRVGDHAALLCLTAEERLRGLVALVTEALRAGDRLVCVLHDVGVATLERAVAAMGVDVAAHVAAGRLALVAAADVLFRGGVFEPVGALGRLRDLVAGRSARRTRLVVDMTYLLADVPGIERGPLLEARLGDALRGLPFVRVCVFDASREISDQLADMLRMHPTVIGAGGPLRNPYYRPWSELRAGRRAAPLARPVVASREAK